MDLKTAATTVPQDVYPKNKNRRRRRRRVVGGKRLLKKIAETTQRWSVFHLNIFSPSGNLNK